MRAALRITFPQGLPKRSRHVLQEIYPDREAPVLAIVTRLQEEKGGEGHI